MKEYVIHSITNLTSVAVGGIIGYLSARYIQIRQFRNEERLNRESLKALLETLKEDMGDYYNRLHDWQKNLPRGVTPLEHFNLSNKEAMWPSLIKSHIFAKNRTLFARINRISRRLAILNNEIKLVQDMLFLRVKLSPREHSETTLKRKKECLLEMINEIINKDLIITSEGLDIQIKLDQIIKSIDENASNLNNSTN